MPRFPNPDASALNLLNQAKKRVIKLQKKKYEDSQSFQKQTILRGEAEKVATALYDQFQALLTNFASVLFEIENVLKSITKTRQGKSVLVDRTISSATASFRGVEQIREFLERKLKYNLNIFSPDQIDSLFSTYNYIDTTIGEIIAGLERLTPDQQSTLSDIVDSWYASWKIIDDKLSPLFQNYKYGLSSEDAGFFIPSDASSEASSVSGAGRRRRILKCGGDSPAGARVAGPYIGMSGKVPPRNTYDFSHPSLPRRFH
jgi:hypothetical protein